MFGALPKLLFLAGLAWTGWKIYRYMMARLDGVRREDGDGGGQGAAQDGETLEAQECGMCGAHFVGDAQCARDDCPYRA